MSLRKETVKLTDPFGVGMGALGISSLIGCIAVSLKYYVLVLTGSSGVMADLFQTIIGTVFSLYFLIKHLFFAAGDEGAETAKSERFEYISGGIGGPLIIIFALIVLWTGFSRIFSPQALNRLPHGLTILFVINLIQASAGVGLMFWGTRYRSHRVILEGKHLISLSYASVAVFIGLLLTYWASLSWIDGMIAAIIGFVILTSGLKLILLPFKGFRDVSEPDFLNAVCKFFNDYRKELWIDIHSLKSAYANKAVKIDFHLILPRDMTLETANKEPEAIRELLADKFGKSARVLVHIEPCVETDCPYCMREICPMRNREKPKKEQCWTMAALTSAEGPSIRLKSKDYAAPASLMSKAISVADYNPRLLEWLFEILAVKGLDHEALLNRMETEKIENRERTLVEEILSQQPHGLNKMLAMMTIFNLPTPKSVIMDICYNINDIEDHLDRAAALGLVETDRRQSVRVYKPVDIVRPFIDEKLVKNRQDLAVSAALSLYHQWWDNAGAVTEGQGLEILRLALISHERRIAVEIAHRLTTQWLSKGRWRETIDECRNTMAAVGDDYRLLRNLAQAENALGQADQALNHYQQALQHCPDQADIDKSSILHNMAVIYTKQGQSAKALTLFAHSLELKVAAGNEKGKAASMSWIALIYSNQGKIEESLKLYRQVLNIQDKQQDMAGKAATLNQIAGILAKKGDYLEAMPLLKQSLDIIEKHKINADTANMMNQMAGIYVNQGRFKEALSLYQQLREIKRRAGDIKGEAATVALMSKISVTMLQHLKTPDIKQVRKFMATAK